MAIPGRNDPCPCGSGKRYKLCHGRIDALDEKVGFVVAGTQKGGTTALATFLLEHPEICMPKVKEVHFFDTEENFAASPVDYARYHELYERKPGQRVLGDRTPIYMFWDAAPLRIWQYSPAMKFILLLRNPGTRAYSQWNMEVKQGRETLSFEEAIRTERERCRDVLPLQHRRWSYLARGMYCEQLRRIWRHFPIERTLIFRSEKFQANPAPALDRIAEFLGVGPFPRTAPRNVFELPYEAPMSDGARHFLRESFEMEIRALERMLRWDLSDWLAELRAA